MFLHSTSFITPQTRTRALGAPSDSSSGSSSGAGVFLVGAVLGGLAGFFLLRSSILDDFLGVLGRAEDLRYGCDAGAVEELNYYADRMDRKLRPGAYLDKA